MGHLCHVCWEWSKVDWEAVKEESSKFRVDFISHHNERTVESNYEAFCQHVNDIITSHVPTKQSNSRHKVPWLTTKLRRMCRKKQRLYNRAKKSRKEHHWSNNCCTTSWDRPNLEIWATTTWNSRARHVPGVENRIPDLLSRWESTAQAELKLRELTKGYWLIKEKITEKIFYFTYTW